ncbi:MAG TPA: tetratricopeptide repeat protein [Burkholderiales bacterium]|nr:tetratricopeptide repeat protein [Burkholderiales bacterium]
MPSPFRSRSILAALMSAGLVAGSFALAQDGPSNNFDPLFDAVSNCFKPKPSDAAWQRQIRLAQTKSSPELRPVSDLKDSLSASLEPVPLWQGLGGLHYRVTTKHPEAQAYFDQGLRLSFAFNHGEARRAFRMAQHLDPQCAMCYWGEALVLGPNINAPMDAQAIAPAWAAIQEAKKHLARATPRERDLISALSERYSGDPGASRAELDARYADAMAALAKRYPADDTIAILYAESLMDLQPWDYWEAGGVKAKPRLTELVPTLERVLKRNARHPGAIHLYIHAVEASNRPQRAEAFAEHLGQLMPGAGHMVHMPSHIYYRLGRYLDALEANRRAVAVDEAYLAQAKAEGVYAVGYYPHNIHFLMASAQMAGDGHTAVAAAEKLARAVPDEVLPVVAMVHPVKAAPYFAHAQFSEPAVILALEAPSEAFPYIRAMWHYARGVAYAQLKDYPRAEGEAKALARIAQKADFKMLKDNGIPASDVVTLAERMVWTRIAQAQGHPRLAVQHLRKAIEIEDRLAYMEPPYWYYPVRQTMGATLLSMGDLDGAEAALRDSLVRSPNNAVALYALAQVHARRGETERAEQMETRFKKAWAGNGPVDLARL